MKIQRVVLAGTQWGRSRPSIHRQTIV